MAQGTVALFDGKTFANWDGDTNRTWRIEAGIQFRSERVPQHHEVCGYQADIGEDVEGHLYDEIRGNRMLPSPSLEIIKQAKAAAPKHKKLLIAANLAQM